MDSGLKFVWTFHAGAFERGCVNRNEEDCKRIKFENIDGAICLCRELSPLKKGEVSVRLTSLYLLVRNQLFQEELKIIFFIFKTT